jgi:hypothetical protein
MDLQNQKEPSVEQVSRDWGLVYTVCTYVCIYMFTSYFDGFVKQKEPSSQ